MPSVLKGMACWDAFGALLFKYALTTLALARSIRLEGIPLYYLNWVEEMNSYFMYSCEFYKMIVLNGIRQRREEILVKRAAFDRHCNDGE
jgi:hypothetical protein